MVSEEREDNVFVGEEEESLRDEARGKRMGSVTLSRRRADTSMFDVQKRRQKCLILVR